MTKQEDTKMHFDKINKRGELPFSFIYGGKSSKILLPQWESESKIEKLDDERLKQIIAFTDGKTGLRITAEVLSYKDYGAIDWVLYLENTGKTDTPIIENLLALDITLDEPMPGDVPFLLHRTTGAPSNPTDFEMKKVPMKGNDVVILSGAGGRSSNADLPFYKIDKNGCSMIIAVGWSGQWKSEIRCLDGKQLNLTAGMELTHFKLLPGEKVRSPRILLLNRNGESIESNVHFRRLIQKYYLPAFNGEKRAHLFCNTCFTRGGGWLNECNEENQISLIRALKPLGVELIITDAGWFEGGWPLGAGNWNVRKDSYPNGIAPVAAAAEECGMIYGLWFEPERVVAKTQIAREHPEWLLWRKGDETTALLNFGIPAVQEYFFNIVDGFMKIPGFRVYRQDFNMDPLWHWRDNDAPDRQGIAEMKYIEGLYAYWDLIAKKYPDSFREECASGGRRIDLETIMRMHIHQKTDYWFDNVVDQASLFSLSQYLPNGTIAGHVNRLDDYSFHSSLASSLCLGWIADDPKFDMEQAKRLTSLYKSVLHLLSGDWYPLTEYNRDETQWLGSQYHRADIDEGMVIMFRRDKSQYAVMNVRLRGLDNNADYEVESKSYGWKKTLKGSTLMDGFNITLEKAPSSDVIVYKKK